MKKLDLSERFDKPFRDTDSALMNEAPQAKMRAIFKMKAKKISLFRCAFFLLSLCLVSIEIRAAQTQVMEKEAFSLAIRPNHNLIMDFGLTMRSSTESVLGIHTAGWPQILFNSGTLIAAPIRYLVLVLFALRLSQFGAGLPFVIAILIGGLISTSGTILMTAVPFSVALAVHITGIGLYFLGIVVLQTLIGIQEWSLKGVPTILPALSFLMVAVFFVFTTLVILYERGVVSRSAPVIWEWLAVSSSVVWVFAQSILLGKTWESSSRYQ